MLVEDLGSKGNGFHRVDSAVGPHLKRELVEVGNMTYAGVFDCVVDL